MKRPPAHVSLYRRSLPSFLVPFVSTRGKTLFKGALNEGNMENYFELSEQYVTQARPEDCAVSSLVMILNSLGIDPEKKWKGPWRWFSEDLLSCVDPLADGFSLHQFLQLAVCNKAWAMGYYSSLQQVPKKEDFQCGVHCSSLNYRIASLDTFRIATIAACRQPKFFLTMNYSRKALSQTGEGHYSPIAGYNAEHDMCLILDVARFKYPAYWCPLPMAYKALQPEDPVCKKSRGFVLASRSREYYSELCSRQMDTVSLKKINKPITKELLQKGHEDLLPIILRLYYDFYEFKPNEAEISANLETIEDFQMDPRIEALIKELNPEIPNAKRMVTGIFGRDPKGVCQKYRKYFGLK